VAGGPPDELPAGLTAGLANGPGRRQPPPRHLADLDPAGRRAAARELGLQPFRADQLSRHYFGRLTDDPAHMTDLPAGAGSTIRCWMYCGQLPKAWSTSIRSSPVALLASVPLTRMRRRMANSMASIPTGWPASSPACWGKMPAP